MKGGLLILIVLGLAAAAPAVAGTVYRCDGGDGVRSYTSKRIPGASCSAISSYKTQTASRAPPVPVAASGSGSVTTTSSVATPATAPALT